MHAAIVPTAPTPSRRTLGALLFGLVLVCCEAAAFPPAHDFEFMGEQVAASRSEVRERLDREFLLMGSDRQQLLLWIKRGERYFDYFAHELRDKGLPEELRYLPVVESSLLIRTTSKAGAGGPWQFMPARARSYGLRVDSHVDERLNVEKATRAAVTHLGDLHETFGSWHLAVAAYNLGDNGVRSRIERQGENNYWNMVFPIETERYLPRLIVVSELLGNAERHGIDLPDAQRYAPLAHDRIDIQIPVGVLFLRDLAQAGSCSFRDLWSRNPWIKGVSLPAGQWQLLTPPGSGEAMLAAARAIHPTHHTVRKGENLTTIAQHYGCSLEDLMQWNNLNAQRPIHPGQRLLLYLR